jgi:DNA processing protein
MAVPGSPGELNAAGTNALLRDGAACCRGAEDVLEDLAPQIVATAAGIVAARGTAAGSAAGMVGPTTDVGAAGNAADVVDSADRRRVLDALPASRGLGVEELGAAAGMAPGRLLAVLLELELAGEVRQLPGRRFLKTGLFRRPI